MSSVEVVAEQNVAVKTSFSHGIQFQCFTHARQVQRFVGQSKYKVIFTQQLSEIPEMPLEGVDDSKGLVVSWEEGRHILHSWFRYSLSL